MWISIEKVNGWVIIRDWYGHVMRYLCYTKKEALSNFKEKYGYTRKRGIDIIDNSRQKK